MKVKGNTSKFITVCSWPFCVHNLFAFHAQTFNPACVHLLKTLTCNYAYYLRLKTPWFADFFRKLQRLKIFCRKESRNLDLLFMHNLRAWLIVTPNYYSLIEHSNAALDSWCRLWSTLRNYISLNGYYKCCKTYIQDSVYIFSHLTLASKTLNTIVESVKIDIKFYLKILCLS